MNNTPQPCFQTVLVNYIEEEGNIARLTVLTVSLKTKTLFSIKCYLVHYFRTLNKYDKLRHAKRPTTEQMSYNKFTGIYLP